MAEYVRAFLASAAFVYVIVNVIILAKWWNAPLWLRLKLIAVSVVFTAIIVGNIGHLHRPINFATWLVVIGFAVDGFALGSVWRALAHGHVWNDNTRRTT
jgi:hypothetical protein